MMNTWKATNSWTDGVYNFRKKQVAVILKDSVKLRQVFTNAIIYSLFSTKSYLRYLHDSTTWTCYPATSIQ